MRYLRAALAFAFTFFAVALAIFVFNRMGKSAYALERYRTIGESLEETVEAWDDFNQKRQLEIILPGQTATTPVGHLMLAGVYTSQASRYLRHTGEMKVNVNEKLFDEATEKVLSELLLIDDCPSLVAEKKGHFIDFVNYRKGHAIVTDEKRGDMVTTYWNSLILDNIDKMYAKDRMLNVGWSGNIKLINGKQLLELSDDEAEKLLKIAYRLQEYGQVESAKSILRAGAFRDFVLNTRPGNENRGSKFTAALLHTERFDDTPKIETAFAKFNKTFRIVRILGMYGLSILALCLLVSLMAHRKHFILFAALYIMVLGVLFRLFAPIYFEFNAYCDAVLNPNPLSYTEFTTMPSGEKCTPEQMLAILEPDATLRRGKLIGSRCPPQQQINLVRQLNLLKTYTPFLFGGDSVRYEDFTDGVDPDFNDGKNQINFCVTRTNQADIYTLDVILQRDKAKDEKLKTFVWDGKKLTLTDFVRDQQTEVERQPEK